MARELQEILNSGEITNIQLTNTSAASASVSVKGQVMKWQGQWEPGSYQLADVVIDENWTMIANKPTEDRAAPQPIGDSEWVRDIVSPSGSFTTETSGASTLFIGSRYEFPDSYIVRDVGIYLPSGSVGLNCAIWGIFNPFTEDEVTINLVPGFDIEESQTEFWNSLRVINRYIRKGTIIDFIMVFRSPSQENSFTYEWDYERKNGNPSSNDIYHQGGSNTDEIRVNKVDEADIDRSTDLDKVHPGSTITMEKSGYVWDVLEVDKIGNIYIFKVDPDVRAPEDKSNFTFTYYNITSISYVVNNNAFDGIANVSGYFGTEYSSASRWLNDNQYGIDIKIQDTASSDDWDVVSVGV